VERDPVACIVVCQSAGGKIDISSPIPSLAGAAVRAWRPGVPRRVQASHCRRSWERGAWKVETHATTPLQYLFLLLLPLNQSPPQNPIHMHRHHYSFARSTLSRRPCGKAGNFDMESGAAGRNSGMAARLPSERKKATCCTRQLGRWPACL
jgi:hypothetical protein